VACIILNRCTEKGVEPCRCPYYMAGAANIKERRR